MYFRRNASHLLILLLFGVSFDVTQSSNLSFFAKVHDEIEKFDDSSIANKIEKTEITC